MAAAGRAGATPGGAPTTWGEACPLGYVVVAGEHDGEREVPGRHVHPVMPLAHYAAAVAAAANGRAP
jgi:hypothetical protein